MLAEVNGHYGLPAQAVPYRESQTENWRFPAIAFKGRVK
jgi:hypothetical protein